MILFYFVSKSSDYPRGIWLFFVVIFNTIKKARKFVVLNINFSRFSSASLVCRGKKEIAREKMRKKKSWEYLWNLCNSLFLINICQTNVRHTLDYLIHIHPWKVNSLILLYYSIFQLLSLVIPHIYIYTCSHKELSSSSSFFSNELSYSIIQSWFHQHVFSWTVS